MAKTATIEAIGERYAGLAEKTCCLSCGGAINYAGAVAGETAIDLGSGKGNDVLRLAEQVGPAGKAFGIDIADGMIEKARKTADRLGVKNAVFLKGELESLPVEDATVDLVISNCVLNHAQDKVKVWKEISRVLKPGGRFVISDIYSTVPVPDEYRDDPVAISECWGGSVTRDEYLFAVESAGFRNIRIREESEPYHKQKIDVCSWTLSGNK